MHAYILTPYTEPWYMPAQILNQYWPATHAYPNTETYYTISNMYLPQALNIH